MKKQFSLVCIGGTFDHLHDGHKKLIDTAFEVGENVVIGLTGDSFMYQKKLPSQIEPYTVRRKALEQYLTKNNISDRAKFVPLYDIYGPAAEIPELQAIIVSKETEGNAKKINSIRVTRKLPQLKIVAIELVKGQSKEIIRSEHIRYGEMDRHGASYIKMLGKKSSHLLPDSLRDELRKPLGKVYKKIEPLKWFVKGRTLDSTTLVISVGDIITASLLTERIVPGVQIIDFKSRRKKDTSVKIPDGKKVFTSKNEAGSVSRSVSTAIEKAIITNRTTNQPQYVIVRGEEDLTALVAILLAPLGSIVLYGHFELGVVEVVITESAKTHVKNLLTKFN